MYRRYDIDDRQSRRVKDNRTGDNFERCPNNRNSKRRDVFDQYRWSRSHESRHAERRKYTRAVLPPHRVSNDSSDEDKKAKRQKTADLVKYKLSALTAEDKSTSIKELLDADESEAKDEISDNSGDKECRRIAHVPKPLNESLPVPSIAPTFNILPVPPPPPLPLCLTQHLGDVSDNYEQKLVQKRIERKLLQDLVKTPLNELKIMVNRPKTTDNIFLSHLMKDTRISLSENFRKFAEQKLQIGLDGSGLFQSELENVLDADIAADMSRLSSETMQTLSDIFNMNLDGDLTPPTTWPTPPLPAAPSPVIHDKYDPFFPTDLDEVLSENTSNNSQCFLEPILTNASYLPKLTPTESHTFDVRPPVDVVIKTEPFSEAKKDRNAIEALAGHAEKAVTIFQEQNRKKLAEPDEHSKHSKHMSRNRETEQKSPLICTNILPQSASETQNKFPSPKPLPLSEKLKVMSQISSKKERRISKPNPVMLPMFTQTIAPLRLNMGTQCYTENSSTVSSTQTDWQMYLKSETSQTVKCEDLTTVPTADAETQTSVIVSGPCQSTQTPACLAAAVDKAVQHVAIQSTRGEQVNRLHFTANKYCQTSKTTTENTNRAKNKKIDPPSGETTRKTLLNEYRKFHEEIMSTSALSTNRARLVKILLPLLDGAFQSIYSFSLLSDDVEVNETNGTRQQAISGTKNKQSSLSKPIKTEIKSISKPHNGVKKETSEPRSQSKERKNRERSFSATKSSTLKKRARMPSSEKPSLVSLPGQKSTCRPVLNERLSDEKISSSTESQIEKLQKNIKIRPPYPSEESNVRDVTLTKSVTKKCDKNAHKISDTSNCPVPSEQEQNLVNNVSSIVASATSQFNSYDDTDATMSNKALLMVENPRHTGNDCDNEENGEQSKISSLNDDDTEMAIVENNSEARLDPGKTADNSPFRSVEWYQHEFSLRNVRVNLDRLPPLLKHTLTAVKDEPPPVPSESCGSPHCNELDETSTLASQNSGKPQVNGLDRSSTPACSDEPEEVIFNTVALSGTGSDEEYYAATTTISDVPCDENGKHKVLPGPIQFQAHRGRVFDFKVSGNHLLVASKDEVHCYSLKNGKRKRMYHPESHIICLSVLPKKDGEIVYCACADQIIRAFCVQTSRLLKSCDQLNAVPRCMDSSGTVSRDGVLYVGLDTGECLSLHPKTLKVLRRLRGKAGVVQLISVTIDDTQFAVVSSDDGLLKIRNFCAADLEQKLDWGLARPAEKLIFHQGNLYCTARLPYVVMFAFDKFTGWSAQQKIDTSENAIAACIVQNYLLAGTQSGRVNVIDTEIVNWAIRVGYSFLALLKKRSAMDLVMFAFKTNTIVADFFKEGNLSAIGIGYKKMAVYVYEDGSLFARHLPIEVRNLMKARRVLD